MLAARLTSTHWINSTVIPSNHKIFQGSSVLFPLNQFLLHNEGRRTKKKYSKDESAIPDEKPKSTANTNEDEHDLGSKLMKWTIQNNISCFSFSRLLKILSEHGIKDLPKNSRELLRAKEQEIKVTRMLPGVYIHFGLEKGLRQLMLNLINKNLFSGTDIGVSIFIDNLPLSKFTNHGLWVILGSICGFTNNIFFVGAYNGYSRPKNSNLFLSEFVSEAKHLCTKGLQIKDLIYNVKISRLICDAPAKAFVLNTKHFRGYSSCSKCNAVGESKGRIVSFPEKSTPRMDEDFEKDEIYQGNKSNLLEIPHFGLVSNVPIDYMHLVCIGVVKKILTTWMKDDSFWIRRDSASDFIRELAPLYPREFRGKPKSFNIFSRWCGNDFREFLLYHGPPALKDNLKKQYLDHFLLLHVACRLLCIEASPKHVDHGRELLSRFVEEYKELYNTRQISHNFHGLYHLADECSSHGTLDSFSAFPFENFLVRVRNTMAKSKKRTIPHTILRESYDKVFTKDLNNLMEDDFKVGRKLKHVDQNQFENFSHHEKLTTRTFEIVPDSKGDKYALLKNGKLIEVTNVLVRKEKSSKTHFVAGKEFCSVSNFHSEPFSALGLNMFTVGEVSDSSEVWPVDMIHKKCMKMPAGNKETVMVGLLDENFDF